MTFCFQVDNRDAEIDRLNGLLEGGRPFDVVALESRNRSNERLISHLNIQVDSITDHYYGDAYKCATQINRINWLVGYV